ncbi:MAG: OadG family protein [Victivallaceae bacterium]|nr:OadG family protein [Victivallaceae bacterium]
MSNSELIYGALKLMVCGMGVVFCFLLIKSAHLDNDIMIGAMNLTTRILAPFAGLLDKAEPEKKAPKAPGDDAELAAVAAVVVEMETK